MGHIEGLQGEVTELKHMHITRVRDVPFKGGSKALVVYVPPNELTKWKRNFTRVESELKKKCPAPVVFIIGEYTILPKTARGRKSTRPRNRSLTNVHERVLEDLVYPNLIVAKRIKFKGDGSRVWKMALNQSSDPDRLLATRKVYKKITHKDITFIE